MCACVQTSGDGSLTTIIFDLWTAQSAKAQGHLWTKTFSSFSRNYFIPPLLPFIHTCILWSFHAVPFPCSFSLLCLLYFHHFPQPRLCPPFPLCLFISWLTLSVSSLLASSHFSLYLCFSFCFSSPSLSPSAVFFLSSLPISGNHKKCICAHTSAYSML